MFDQHVAQVSLQSIVPDLVDKLVGGTRTAPS